MFQPLSSLFSRKKPVRYEEVDVRHFVQRFLRDLVRTEALYCEQAHTGLVVVRVASPSVQQEVLLLESDVRQALADSLGFSMHTFRVIRQ